MHWQNTAGDKNIVSVLFEGSAGGGGGASKQTNGKTFELLPPVFECTRKLTHGWKYVKVAEENPFGTEFFFWADIGYLRTAGHK